MKSIFVRVFIFSLVFLAFCYFSLYLYIKIRLPIPDIDITRAKEVIEKNIQSYDLKDEYQKVENNIYLMFESLNFLKSMDKNFFTYIQSSKKNQNLIYDELITKIDLIHPSSLAKIELFDNFKLKRTFDDIKKNGFNANFGDYISYMKYNKYWLIVAEKKFNEYASKEGLEILESLYKISSKLLQTEQFFPIAMGINLKIEISEVLAKFILKSNINHTDTQKIIKIIEKLNSIDLKKFMKNEYKMINLVILITMEKISSKDDSVDALSTLMGIEKQFLYLLKPFLKHIVQREIAISIYNLENKIYTNSSLDGSLLQYVIMLKPSNLNQFFRRIEASNLFDLTIIDIIKNFESQNFNINSKEFDYYTITKCNKEFLITMWDKDEPKFKLTYQTDAKIDFEDFLFKRESFIDIKCKNSKK